MTTVWVALTAEAVVLLTAAGVAVKWVRQSSTGGPDQQDGQPA